jgi:hypothetical protein
MKTDKKEIFRELLLSENRGYVLGIKIKGMNRPIKTAIHQVDHNKIVFESTCIYGYPLERTIYTLVDIEWVKRYKVLFSSPVYESIRIIKNNIQLLRNTAGNHMLRSHSALQDENNKHKSIGSDLRLG